MFQKGTISHKKFGLMKPNFLCDNTPFMIVHYI